MVATTRRARTRRPEPGDLISRTLVVLPVHDERENLQHLLPRVLGLGCSVLAVEDASKDGSAEYLDAVAAPDSRVSVVHRAALLGLGTAYVEGFRRGAALGFEAFVQMDADLSHDPDEIPRLLAALEEADVAIGSRYVLGGSTPGWPLRRRALSRLAGLYVRLWTGLPFSDPTGGFRAFRSPALSVLDLPSIRSRGFAFQIEVLARAHAARLRIREVPITFRERAHGRSKLSSRVVLEALATVPWLRHLVGRATTSPDPLRAAPKVAGA